MKHHPTTQSVIDLAFENRKTRQLYEILLEHDLPNWAIVSGCIFQPVWNALTNRSREHGIRDYDVFYFDHDVSYEKEDQEIRRLETRVKGLDIDVELRNQARVHLWYGKHFGLDGKEYPALKSSLEGIDRFLMPCCAIGIYPDQADIQRRGQPKLYAPYGTEDLFDMIIRPNEKVVGFQADNYYAKARRWQMCWPEAKIVDYE